MFFAQQQLLLQPTFFLDINFEPLFCIVILIFIMAQGDTLMALRKNYSFRASNQADAVSRSQRELLVATF